MAGLRAVLDVVGPVGQPPVFPQRAELLGLRDAARPTAPGTPRQLLPGARGQAAARVVRVARPINRLRAHTHARLAQVRRRGVRGPTQPQALIDRSGQHRIIRQLGDPNASRPRTRRRVRRAGVIARTLAAAGQLAMHRRRVTAPAAALRPRRPRPAPSDDSTNTRSSKLSLAAILDTSIGRLHVLATVIMTVHLQPPMEFADVCLPVSTLKPRVHRYDLDQGLL